LAVWLTAGGCLVFGRRCLEFLEFHLQLGKQLLAALGGSAKTIPLQLGDYELQMRNHRLGT